MARGTWLATFSDIDQWLQGTSLFSVHVFGYALVVAWRYPRTRRVWRHVGWATALALFPGLLLAAIPTLIGCSPPR